MSSTGDERWRTPRGQQPPSQNQNRQPNQQQHQNSSRERASGGQTPSRQMLGGQGFTAVSGNAWANNDRGNRDATPYGLPQEQHAPQVNFNAQEVRDTLKKAYNSTISEDMKVLKYKAPGGQASNAKGGGGPWGVRPNTMGNGKDFFLELRKQLSALQQGGERAGG